MNFIKKTISFLTIVCCLAGSLLPAYAAESGGTSDFIPIIPTGPLRVTFTNEPNNSPDLFVGKVVENALSDARYEAPKRAAYRFVLKIDGKIAAKEEYRLLDAGYGELTKKINGLKIPFKTDSAGTFTLEDDQKAWFEYVGTGRKYEVIELPDYLYPIIGEDGTEKVVGGGYGLYDESGTLVWKELEYQTRSLYVDGYEQKSPVGDSANGASTGERTILFNGNQEIFTNRYTGKGTGDVTTLKVSKSVAFPTGYTAPETPDFRFKVELDGKQYAEKEFKVLDENGNAILNEETQAPLVGKTDIDGIFTLKGGQTAIFEGVPTELDYRVSELPENEAVPEGSAKTGEKTWWAIGDTQKEGSTQAPVTLASFTNTNVSFLVTKRMEDYSKPDVEFTFRLTDDKNDALAGESYYLYHTNGTPVYDDAEKQMVGTTGNDGSFRLKPGQSAIFVGMEPGRTFRVSEEGNPDYAQVLPLPTSKDIYTVRGGGSPLFIDFVNKPADNKGVLTVTKKLAFDKEGPAAKDDFYFILYKQLKTQADIEKALGITKVLFFTIGNVDGARIEGAVNSGEIVLSEASEEALADAAIEGQPGNIEIVNGIWYYMENGKRYEMYVPLEDAVYSVQEGISAASYKTGIGGEAGEFTIKADQTARFELLAASRKYMVREIKLTEEYAEDRTDSAYVQIHNLTQPQPAMGEGAERTGAVYAQRAELSVAGTSFIFRNAYTAKKVDLSLTKIDKDGKAITKDSLDAEGNLLTKHSAEFMLYRTKGRENPVYEGSYATDDAGNITFPDLKAGTYWLYELQAPSSYKLLAAPIEIQIAWGRDGEPEVTIDGRALAEGGDVVKNGSVTGDGITDGKKTIHIEVVNADFYKLPSTGGTGIYWYEISGILLMMAALLIVYKNKRAGEVRGS